MWARSTPSSSYGAKLVGVKMEDDGIDVADLEAALQANPNAKLFYTIPSFHNPTGITTSYEKRKAVYALCAQYGVVILEDNPYGELTFDGEKLPPYKSMDGEGIVLYCNSFSKVLSPGLRVGYAIGHKDLIQKMVDSKQTCDVHTPILNQLMTYEYLKRYDIDAAIAKMRVLYRDKCQVMLDAIERVSAQVHHPHGAQRRPVRLVRYARRLRHPGSGSVLRPAESGVRPRLYVYGGRSGPPCSAFRLNYSTMENARIVEGVKLLGEALRNFMK